MSARPYVLVAALLFGAGWAGVLLRADAVAGAGAGSAASDELLSSGRIALPAVFRNADLDNLPPTVTAVPPTATSEATATAASPTATFTATATEANPDKTPGVPACGGTGGDAGGFRFSLDGGVSLAPNSGRLADVAYTWALDVDPRDPDVILELHQRRVFRSADAGCTFVELPGVPQDDWDQLERAQSDPDVLVLTSVFAARLAYSADGGGTWLTEDLPDDVMALAIDPADPWRWTFVGRGPVIYSRDAAGDRWQSRSIPLEAGQSIVAAASAPSLPARWLVASATQGLYRSDDAGETWRAASEGLFASIPGSSEPTHAVVVSFVAFAPSDADTVYATVNQVTRTGSLRGLWRSSDGGSSWAVRVRNDDVIGAATARLTAGTRVFVSPVDPERTFFAFGMAYAEYGSDLYRSGDGLQTYEVSHFDGFYKIYAMAFGPAGTDVVFVGASSDIPSD